MLSATASAADVERFCRERNGRTRGDAWIDSWTQCRMTCRSSLTGLRAVDIVTPEAHRRQFAAENVEADRRWLRGRRGATALHERILGFYSAHLDLFARGVQCS